MGNAVIAGRPPNDGREWDAQCARCGSSVTFVRCDDCGGDGEWFEDDDWDDEPRARRCDTCDGAAGWRVCLSRPAWCEGNPLPGREDVERGKVEWFVAGESDHG